VRRSPLTLSRLRDLPTPALDQIVADIEADLLREHRVGDDLPEPNAIDFLYVAELARRGARRRDDSA